FLFFLRTGVREAPSARLWKGCLPGNLASRRRRHRLRHERSFSTLDGSSSTRGLSFVSSAAVSITTAVSIAIAFSLFLPFPMVAQRKRWLRLRGFESANRDPFSLPSDCMSDDKSVRLTREVRTAWTMYELG